jgi:acetyltransferase-like isoleucine patch superfamily enzyme|tara:strand:+ start:1544 stop:2377 length:834 start_codon:yes stop_codon:yes gene_type:complete
MISKNAIIESNDIQIGKNVIIGDGVEIRCPEKIHIGDNSVLTKNIKINCTSFEAGEYFYMTERCEVGRGGCYGPNSRVKIGKHVGIFEGTVINPSEEVEIGDDTGIGGDVMIWTHGAWLDVLQGFPADFGPVKIGSNVWLPARSVVLPHVIIGDNVVIGINSIINRSLPDGCFAAGSPCKVIKENVYPKKLTEDEKKNIVLEIIDGWYKLHDMKKIKDVLTKYEDGKIYLNQGKHQTIYYMDERKIEGYNNNVSEDLRDYMRRRGIKIYTGELFRSI